MIGITGAPGAGKSTLVDHLAREYRRQSQTVGIVGDDLPCSEYAAIMSRVLGKKVVYNHMPREQYAQLGFPGADDLAAMFEFNRLYIPNRQADLEESRSLYAGMQRFESWVRANKARLTQLLEG